MGDRMDNDDKDRLERYNKAKAMVKEALQIYYKETHGVMNMKCFSRQDRNLLRSSVEHLMHFESCVEELSTNGSS